MNVIRVLISAGALVFLFWQIGFGETVAVLQGADLRYLGIALGLYVGSLVVRAFRWFVLLRALDSGVPFGRLVRLYFVGQFFSSFLPTQFGGDVVRAAELTRDTQSAAAIGTVLLDRMSGLMVLFMMGLAVLPFQAARMPGWLVALLLGVAGAGLVAGALILEGRLLRGLTRRLPVQVSLAGEGPLARIYTAVTSCGRQAVLAAFAVSLLFNVMNVLINWLCGQAVGMSIGLGYFFVVTPLIAVGGLVPSVGGWGVRETVSAAVLGPVKVDPNVAAAMGLALGGVGLVAGLIGGLVYGAEALWSLRKDRPVAPVDHPGELSSGEGTAER
jgi:uncharacterized membrane protein YbhN (UPF0104 family)